MSEEIAQTIHDLAHYRDLVHDLRNELAAEHIGRQLAEEAARDLAETVRRVLLGVADIGALSSALTKYEANMGSRDGR